MKLLKFEKIEKSCHGLYDNKFLIYGSQTLTKFDYFGTHAEKLQ